MGDKKLDFLIIGAQKSATTTLHRLLQSHPQLHLPPAKEVPFFSDDVVYKKGMGAYLNNFFGGADINKLWGTVTPQYMLGQNNTRPQEIADRIYHALPHVKIIALLRNPAERAFSHYKMAVHRNYEVRNFEKVVTETISNADLLRNKLDPAVDYIFGGEYGRILNYYYSLFPRDNILVLTTNELQNAPIETIQSLCNLLGVDDSFVPENAGKRYYQGGRKPKTKLLTPGFLFRIPFVEKGWKCLTPQPLRKRVEYFINKWNVRPDDESIDKCSPVYQKLMEFYREDSKLLETLVERRMPWTQLSAQ